MRYVLSAIFLTLLLAAASAPAQDIAPAPVSDEPAATDVAPVSAEAAAATDQLAAETTAAPTPPAGPSTVDDLLALMPASTRSFFVLADLGDVSAKALRLQQRTGIKLPLADANIGQLIDLKIGLSGGVAPRGAVGIAYLNPEQFKDRNAIFLVPIENLDSFIEYNSAQKLESNLFQLTTTPLPRFFVPRGQYVLFTDSLKLARAVRDEPTGFELSADQKSVARQSDAFIHLDFRRSPADRDIEAERFRAGMAAKVLGEPTLRGYADLLFGYFSAVDEFFKQIDVVDFGLTLDNEDLNVSSFITFSPNGAVRQSLLDIRPSYAPLAHDLPLDRPFISAGGVDFRTDLLRLAVVRGSAFILDNSPQVRQKVRPQTRDILVTSLDDFMKQLTGQFASMTAMPTPESGAVEANLSVAVVDQPKTFLDDLGNLLRSLNQVADEVGSRVTIKFDLAEETYRDVGIAHIRPRIVRSREKVEQLFDERAKAVYGPDGMLYRLAVVKDHVFITCGSDLTLFHAALDNAIDDKPFPESPALKQVRAGLPEGRNVEYYVSLPAVLSRMMVRSGSAEGASRGPVEFDEADRKFIESRGLVGVVISFRNGTVRFDTRAGYDQLREAVEFAEKHLPPVIPEPTPEPTTTEPATPSPSPEPDTSATPGPEPSTSLIPIPGPSTTPIPAPGPFTSMPATPAPEPSTAEPAGPEGPATVPPPAP